MKRAVSNAKMPQPDNQGTGVTAPQTDNDVSLVLMSTDPVMLPPDETLTQNMFFSASQ
jgi:hypothetical protein